jgi:hypothetical protein
MDTYFCYIHRASKPVAELKILTCEDEAALDNQMSRLMAEYPGARLEVFLGDEQIRRIDTGDALEV